MIQSAEEVITEIADDRTGIVADKIERGRSRDKAIIERCKEAIDSLDGPHVGSGGLFSADTIKTALDSVLRELSE